jgi:hypothetical protein
MSGTQKVNRYYTPETTGLISDLKEARERKQMVVNEFQFRVRFPSFFLASSLSTLTESLLLLTALRRVRQALCNLDGPHQGRLPARLPPQLVQILCCAWRALCSSCDRRERQGDPGVRGVEAPLHSQVRSPFPPSLTSGRGKLSKNTLLQRLERLHPQRPLSRRRCEEYDAPYRSQRAFFLVFLSLFLQTNPFFPCLQMAGKSTLLRMTCTAVIMAQRTSHFLSRTPKLS